MSVTGRAGRLTEAVRRKPYSVILLDEVEKAHTDVHEISFRSSTKAYMDDGNGRRIDFKNTLIILTTNVGTDLIMELSADLKYRDDPEALAQELRPELLKVFPPALPPADRFDPLLPADKQDARRNCPSTARSQVGAASVTVTMPHLSTGKMSSITSCRKCNDPGFLAVA